MVQLWVLDRFRRIRVHLNESASWSSSQRTRMLTFIAVDLHNTCSAFLRSYYLSSATGARLITGEAVSTAQPIADQEDALTFAVHLAGRGRGRGPWQRMQEPPWHDSTTFLRVLNAAGCSNATGVNAAWSIQTEALAHLTRARHFMAHRNSETAVRLRQLSQAYGLPAPRQPDSLMLMRGRGRPQPIINDWMDDLEAVFSLMPA